MSKPEIRLDKRRSAMVTLSDFCHFATKKEHYVETTEWANGEGFDVEMQTIDGKTRLQFTYGEWDALRACLKALDKDWKLNR